MAYSYNKLRGRIVEKYGTQGKFAEALKISNNLLSRKLNCKVGISQEDIIKWCELLEIENTQIYEYFFA